MDACSTQPSPFANIETDVAIIGSGFAGICMAIRLQQSGMTRFMIAEKARSIGGTWRDNHYPGCACDVQSHVYSFSFAPNPRWTQTFAGQPEIRAYLEDCTARFGVEPHLRLDHELVSATYDEACLRWQLLFTNGAKWSARALVSAMGCLSRAALPGIEGLDRFAGKSFHSQQWDHDYVLAGKRVAVIGTGASAIQFVPHLARQVARLTLFQRTPPWIMPRVDRPVRAFESWLFHHLPFAQRLLRASLFWKLEARAVGFALRPSLMKAAQRAAVRHLHRQVKAPGLRAALTPDYTIGCKRILLSNDYLPALTRENVALVTGKIAYVDSDAIVTDDGTRHPVDCIIYGTGFQAVQPFARGLIRGRGGIDIVDAWRDGAHAYLGSSMPGYPNFFMIAGPNTGLGHNSMVYMIEAQVDYILGALQTLGNEPNIALEVCSGVERAYNARIQRRLSRAVWTAGGCKSWYLDPRSGRNTVLWPGFAFRFRQATRVFRREDYDTHALPGLPLAGRPARMQSGTDAATVEALPTG